MGEADLAGPNAESRREHEHEAELKLILSSNVKSWNISENFILKRISGTSRGNSGTRWE